MRYLVAIMIIISAIRFGSLPSQVTLWPQATVYYEIHPSLTPQARTHLHHGMNEWTQKTGVKFIENPKAFNRVVVMDSDGCSSALGMILGPQIMELSENCGRSVAIHELGHALGLPHEHQRYDRDHYIKLRLECIKDGSAITINFAKLPFGMTPSVGPYDKNSIMHYDSYTFAKSLDCKTMTMLKDNSRIGFNLTLSDMDVKKIKFMYYWKLKGGL